MTKGEGFVEETKAARSEEDYQSLIRLAVACG